MTLINSIEGARVFFCLVVFLHHWQRLFMPESPTLFVNDGNLAVIFFLLISGFVSPMKLWNSDAGGGREFCEKMYKRYMRLFPVIFMSIIFAWSIQDIAYYNVRPYLRDVQMLPLAEKYYSEIVSFGEAIKQAIFTSYIGRPSLDTPLWTIKYEFWGYGIIVLTTFFGKKARKLLLIIETVLAAAFVDVYMAAVFLGAIISNEYISNEKLNFFCKKSKTAGYVWLLLSFFICIVNCYMNNRALRLALAILILLVLLNDNILSAFLSSKKIVQFSKYTYPFYALHWPIVYVFGGETLVLASIFGISYKIAVFGSFVVAIGVAILITVLYSYLRQKVQMLRNEKCNDSRK